MVESARQPAGRRGSISEAGPPTQRGWLGHTEIRGGPPGSSGGMSIASPPFHSLRVSVMLLPIGIRCSHGPRPTSAAVARKTSAPGTAAPATQRPGVGKLGDRLLYQGAQPACTRLNARCAWLGGSLVLRSSRGARQLVATLGHAPDPVQQAGDLGDVQHPIQPRQGKQLLLVAAARQPPSHHGSRHGRSTRPRLGGGGMPLGVVQHRLAAQPAGRRTRVASPSTHTASRPRPSRPDAQATRSVRPRLADPFRGSRVPRWEPDAPPGSLGTGRPAHR